MKSRDNVVVISPHSREDREDRPKRVEFDPDEAFKDMGIKSFKHEYRRLSKMAGADDFAGSQAAYSLEVR